MSDKIFRVGKPVFAQGQLVNWPRHICFLAWIRPASTHEQPVNCSRCTCPLAWTQPLRKDNNWLNWSEQHNTLGSWHGPGWRPNRPLPLSHVAQQDERGHHVARSRTGTSAFLQWRKARTELPFAPWNRAGVLMRINARNRRARNLAEQLCSGQAPFTHCLALRPGSWDELTRARLLASIFHSCFPQ